LLGFVIFRILLLKILFQRTQAQVSAIKTH
jgi:hypothetical protein